jgi:hypothetical protein
MIYIYTNIKKFGDFHNIIYMFIDILTVYFILLIYKYVQFKKQTFQI